MNTLLQHQIPALQNSHYKTQLMKHCNEHGYEQGFRHKFTLWRLNHHPERVQDFLNGLQEDLDFQHHVRA